MAKPRILWQIYPLFLLVTILPLLAITLYLSREIRQFHSNRVSENLRARALLIRRQVYRQVQQQNHDRLDAVVKDLGRESATRITVILPSGLVIADSHNDPAVMNNHANRPEIKEAMKEGIGGSARYSDTLEMPMRYVALRVEQGEAGPLVVRTAVPVSFIDETVARLRNRMAVVAGVIAILAAGICLYVSRRVSRPLEQMKQTAHRIAAGDFHAPLPRASSEEVAGLADALRQMAMQLEDRIDDLVQQRNELGAVLSSMVEGVLAVDVDGEIISVNRAAAHLFGVEEEDVTGKKLQAVIRHADLHAFLARAFQSEQPIEEDMVIYSEGQQLQIQLHGTTLRDAQGRRIGTLVVLNDVTRMRRLERIRRDFVANVSHEIKTPLTAIKGFVETLLDDPAADRGQMERFLQIIADRAEQLEAIIEDILSLSKIEQGETNGIVLEDTSVAAIVSQAVQTCEIKAVEKHIAVEQNCPADLVVRANPILLEQAVSNLIDNAIKYSEPESLVEVDAYRENDYVHIDVRDRGCGIEKEHLPRLFERFYRVDKARSRTLGGTGLGLAIVKHIAQTHGGTVSVASTPGEGSSFTIRLPMQRKPGSAGGPRADRPSAG